MSPHASSRVRITIPDLQYTQIIELLDTRIKSERARASAFRCRADRSNEMIANGTMSRLLILRNAIAESCCLEVDDA